MQPKIEEFLWQYKEWKDFGLKNNLLKINDYGVIVLTKVGQLKNYDKQKPTLNPDGVQAKLDLDNAQ